MTVFVPNRPAEELSEAQFRTIADLARREAGLAISPSKSAMVYSRLFKRMRRLGMSDMSAYCRHLAQTSDRAELDHLVSALTTNVTQFFREQHHFEQMRADILPQLKARLARGKSVRIWSAGCSEGMEPYSIALTLIEADPQLLHRDLRILGTDIDREVIERARRGIYPATKTRRIPETLRHLGFERLPLAPGQRPQDRALRVRAELRSLVQFNVLNLFDPWPMRGQFDVIFCRNVVIYFDPEARLRLWPRFNAALREDGWLFLGHSERIVGAASAAFVLNGMTAYRKAARPDRYAAPGGDHVVAR